jgi:hypothetical protein
VLGICKQLQRQANFKQQTTNNNTTNLRLYVRKQFQTEQPEGATIAAINYCKKRQATIEATSNKQLAMQQATSLSNKQ